MVVYTFPNGARPPDGANPGSGDESIRPIFALAHTLRYITYTDGDILGTLSANSGQNIEFTH